MRPSHRQLMALPPEERARYEKSQRRGWLLYATAWIVLIVAITGSQYFFKAADNLAANDTARSCRFACSR
jgi:hypothetical protein